ncbi:MAG: response regulator [Candidatus Zixiibacteriota bacterium]
MKQRILVIDDTSVIRDFLFEVLTDEGFSVDVANNGVIGSEMALANDYLIIFCDIHMPMMNGFQTVQRIRESKPDIPIVVTDSYPSKLAQQASEAGAIKCLAKPFSLEELRLTINDVIENKKAAELK